VPAITVLIATVAPPFLRGLAYVALPTPTRGRRSEADAARHNATFERIARSGLALPDSTALIERVREEL
jgi:hypothetical protein